MLQLNSRLFSWASMLEDKTCEQAVATSGLPFIWPHVALMPDAHWGMGSTVGSVIPTLDVVMPAAVGVDIGCGMAAVRTQFTADDVEARGDLRALRLAIEQRVPVSPGVYRKELTDSADARAFRLSELADTTNVDPDRWSTKVDWTLQLGTLGGGNHFIELVYDEVGRVWAFLHSGSRGVGNKIAQHHIAQARKLCERWHVQLPHPDLAYLPQADPAFVPYLRDLQWAQAFALANRAEMLDQVVAALAQWAGVPVVTEEQILCHHNYTERERHRGKEVWLTRKGAINAEVGRRGLIPGSMGTRSYVVVGKGNPLSFNSAPHGAGRNFSRAEARRRFTAEDLADAMKGIEWRSELGSAFVDEIPGAYKDIDQIMIDAADLVKVEHTLRQFLNVKGQ